MKARWWKRLRPTRHYSILAGSPGATPHASRSQTSLSSHGSGSARLVGISSASRAPYTQSNTSNSSSSSLSHLPYRRVSALPPSAVVAWNSKTRLEEVLGRPPPNHMTHIDIWTAQLTSAIISFSYADSTLTLDIHWHFNLHTLKQLTQEQIWGQLIDSGLQPRQIVIDLRRKHLWMNQTRVLVDEPADSTGKRQKKMESPFEYCQVTDIEPLVQSLAKCKYKREMFMYRKKGKMPDLESMTFVMWPGRSPIKFAIPSDLNSTMWSLSRSLNWRKLPFPFDIHLSMGEGNWRQPLW